MQAGRPQVELNGADAAADIAKVPWITVRRPPFGTPPPMTIWLVADIRNRLFRRAGIGGASGCNIPSMGRNQQPEMGNDYHGAG
jgi:hypothetical protein